MYLVDTNVISEARKGKRRTLVFNGFSGRSKLKTSMCLCKQ